jgi:hypothetical protein
MNHVEVIKRAWHMVTRYRALWVFGIILALTTTTWGPNMSSRGTDGGDSNQKTITIDPESDFSRQVEEAVGEDVEDITRLFEEGIPPALKQAAITAGIVLACVVLLLIVVFCVLRYVAEVALIRMVDEYEKTGEQSNWRQGLRMGWSRSAWRIFLICLVTYIPAILAVILVSAVVMLPLAFGAANTLEGGNIPAGVFWLVVAVGFFFLIILLAIVLFVALALLEKFFWRVCVLEDRGVFDSIREGYAVARQHLKAVGLMWLIMLGVHLGYPILVIPIVLLLMAAGLLVGGVSGLVTRGIAGLLVKGVTAWIVAGAVAVPVFVLVLVVPLIFLGGLREVFTSSSWTLTYRELRALESVEPVHPPDLPAPDAA